MEEKIKTILFSSSLSIYLILFVSIYLILFLSIYLSIYLYLSILFSLYWSLSPSSFCRSISLALFVLSTNLNFFISIYLSIYLDVSLCLDIYLLLSVCLSLHFSVFLSHQDDITEWTKWCLFFKIIPFTVHTLLLLLQFLDPIGKKISTAHMMSSSPSYTPCFRKRDIIS